MALCFSSSRIDCACAEQGVDRNQLSVELGRVVTGFPILIRPD